MKHLDLFSGIGGFAIAVDEVWPGSEHIFCDNDKFCQAVLKKHWPQSKIYGDIRSLHADGFTSDSDSDGCSSRQKEVNPAESDKQILNNAKKHYGKIDIITGGFPCQPFSQAGKRKGTDDDRYLWLEMLRIIREFKPTWVIAENVRGLITWNDGMVLEQVCSDLEGEGYEVQPLVIPAVAVNAPHRRDRVWFIAHRKDERSGGRAGQESIKKGRAVRSENKGLLGYTSNSNGQRLQRMRNEQNSQGQNRLQGGQKFGWDANWIEAATELCSLDDGLPVELDGLKLTKAGHRNAQLKAYGNAIVPQVAIEIMKAIKNNGG